MTTYRVTSATGFLGHKEGDEFDAELTPEQERRAKHRGAIRVVRRGDDNDKTKSKEKEGESDA